MALGPLEFAGTETSQRKVRDPPEARGRRWASA